MAAIRPRGGRRGGWMLLQNSKNETEMGVTSNELTQTVLKI